MDRSPVSLRPPDVAVVGAGLAGLTAAALVERAGHTVSVFERSAEPGGQARSSTVDGFTFNRGPHAFYRGGSAERVLTDLGVALRGRRPAKRGRVVVDGRAVVGPAGPMSLLRCTALGARDKADLACALARIPRQDPHDVAHITVDEWIAGSLRRERPAQLVRALVRLATYVNQPDELSADVAITQLQSALGPGVLYLDGGWQRLVEQLRARVGSAIVHERCDGLPEAAVVIVATGGPTEAARLLGRDFDLGPAASVSTIDYGLRRPPANDTVIGGDVPFYFSNHSAAADDLAPVGSAHAAAVQYLADGEEPDPDAIRAFVRHAGVRDEDIVTQRRLHRLATVTAIATARHGGLRGRPGVGDTGDPDVFLTGDWIGPDGHLADAVVASAEAAARAALSRLRRRAAA